MSLVFHRCSWRRPHARRWLALGSTAIGVSLLTDYALSAAKIIPIEAHELLEG